MKIPIRVIYFSLKTHKALFSLYRRWDASRFGHDESSQKTLVPNTTQSTSKALEKDADATNTSCATTSTCRGVGTQRFSIIPDGISKVGGFRIYRFPTKLNNAH